MIVEECADFAANGHQRRGIAESARRDYRVSLREIYTIEDEYDLGLPTDCDGDGDEP